MIDDLFGFIPHNIELYKLALIHKSASLVLDDGRSINNERLEFLGDAVIEAVTSDYLYIEFPDRDEGFLTQLRSKIVSRQSLNALAVELGLDRQVISSGGVAVVQKHIYGDAFEAMMGAIYLDQGYDFVNRLLINKIYFRYLNIDTLTEEETDFKSRLIEWCQKHRHKVLFRTGQERGAASNRPLFYATVLIDDMEVGHGSGESKKEAEQRAALSVAESLTDERCATLLDKFDRLEQGAAGRTARGGSATGGTATGETAPGAVATAEAATDRAAARGKSRAGSKAGADSQKGAESGAGSDVKSGTDAVDSGADSRSADAPKAAVQSEEAPNAGSAPKSRRRRRRGASAGEGAPAAEEGGSVAKAVVPVASAAVAPDAEDIAVSAEAAESAEEPAMAVAAEVAGAVTSAIEEDTVPAAEAIEIIETTETIESRPEQTAEPASQIDMQSEEPQSEEPQPEPAASRAAEAAEATETAEAAFEPERTPAPAPEFASSRPAAAGADSHSEKH